jgi:hypothetical protein
MIDDHDHEFDVLAQFVSPRRGAPCNNQNRTTHGLTGMGWPKGSENDRRRVARFTRALQVAVLEVKGTITIIDAATIQSAARWERHARLCGRWLRLEAEKFSPDQRLNFSREIAKASESRDRCLRLLGIDRGQPDPWSIIDNPPTAGGHHHDGQDDHQHGHQQPSDATASQPEAAASE